MVSSFGQIASIASKYPTDNIFILGKGPSADDLNISVLDLGVVITLNDAEKIGRGDIGLFHASWVLESLRESGFQCSLYITNQRVPNGVQSLHTEFIPATQFNTDLIVKRFFEKDLQIENVMLVTALKIARIIATARMRRQKVYLIGFDFDSSRGYSKRLGLDYSGVESGYQANVISAQEHYFLVFLQLLKDSNIHIIHVGNRPYSMISCQDLNHRLGCQIGDGEQKSEPVSIAGISKRDRAEELENNVIVTAELTTNHFGDLDRLEMMIRKAKEAGADLVKVQKRDVETFYQRAQLDSPFESPFGTSFGAYRHALELDLEGFALLRDVSNEVGIKWFCSVLDRPSFDFVMQFAPSMIKLPSTISKHTSLLEFVARNFDGDIVISTGLTDESFEDFVVDVFSSTSTVYLLQCTSAYPTPPHECNVAVVRHYRDLADKHPNLRPGYSSHDFGSTASMLAVAAGAKMVEKHVKLGDAPWAHFDSVAMDLASDAFHRYVSDIRLAERILGSEQKSIGDSEHHKYWPAGQQ